LHDRQHRFAGNARPVQAAFIDRRHHRRVPLSARALNGRSGNEW